MLLILIGLLFTLTNACNCVSNNTGIPVYNRFPMYSNYSYQWIYYLLNDGISTNNVLFVIKESNNNCNSSTDSYYYKLVHRNLELNTSISWNDKLVSTSGDGENFGIYMPSIESLLMRIDNLTYIKGNNYSLTIHDELGIYPQGENGLVHNGKYLCQTSYSYSLPKVNYSFNYDNKVYTGIGYGEYISGSMFNYPSEYSGWHCHYLHLTNYSCMLCNSYPINGTIDKYARGMFIKYDTLDRTWLTYKDFKFENTKIYEGYKIGWDVELPQLDLSLHLNPVIDNQFITYPVTTAWQGTIEISGSEIGVGFTEICR